MPPFLKMVIASETGRWFPSLALRTLVRAVEESALPAERLLDCAPRFLRLVLAAVALTVLAIGSPSPMGAQDPPPKDKPQPNTSTATQNAPDQPVWDPLRADKDLEVGQYYLHKGDIDAAIDRFQDAALAKPGYAIPFRFLGEAQEKKGLKRDALKSYTRYLDLYPRAEDKDKIEKKIERLRSEVAKSKKKS
jgi:tetratricopeptide (TPR) repeat protein